MQAISRLIRRNAQIILFASTFTTDTALNFLEEYKDILDDESNFNLNDNEISFSDKGKKVMHNISGNLYGDKDTPMDIIEKFYTSFKMADKNDPLLGLYNLISRRLHTLHKGSTPEESLKRLRDFIESSAHDFNVILTRY